jgi:hypothetical protein
MIAESLLTFIKSNIAGDYYIGELPINGGDCTALIYAPSPNSNYSIDFYEQHIDIMVRNKKTDNGYTQMENIFKLLHAKGNYVMGDYYVYFSSALGNIIDFDRDAQRNKRYKLTIRFIYRELADSS